MKECTVADRNGAVSPVMSDNRASARVKEKVQKSRVRAASLCGSETEWNRGGGGGAMRLKCRASLCTGSGGTKCGQLFWR